MADSAYLLVWNPSLWPWRDFARQSARLKGGELRGSWSSGSRRELESGSSFYLMRVGVEPKGIIGAGRTTHPPRLMAHWDPKRARRREKTWFVGTHFDVLQGTPVLDLNILESSPFPYFNWTPRGSGVEIPADVVRVLRRKWQSALAEGSTGAENQVPPGYPEGGKRKVVVDAYERDRRNRALCIAYYGAFCYTCGMDFESVYGPDAAGFIHVHHVYPLRGKISKPDPTRDLIPVCPNCHAVIHLSNPPLDPRTLRSRLRRRGV